MVKIKCHIVKNSDVKKLDRKIKNLSELKKAGAVVKFHTSVIQNIATQLTPVDTGELKKSWRNNFKQDGSGIKAEVGNVKEYAGYVEKGTRFMDAQPYLKPAVDNDAPDYIKDLKKAIKEA